MKIFGDSISGNCLKVKYTADLLDLDYEWVEVNILKGESRTADYLRMSPQGQVPVVQLDDGRVIAQSNGIIRFLARGSDLLPDDAFEQAKIDEWLFWEQYNHEPYIAVCRFQMRYLNKTVEELEPWRVERGNAALDFMEQHLVESQWLANDRFSIADISLYAYTSMAAEGGFELQSRSNLKRWLADCTGRLILDIDARR